MEPVGNSARMPCVDFAQTQIVRAKDHFPPGLLPELLEMAADGIDVLIIIQMFLVDVEND